MMSVSASGMPESIDRNMTSPTAPTPDIVILVGGGRNANNLAGLLEGVGLQIAAILDDRTPGEVLGHAVSAIDTYAGPQWHAVMTITDPKARRSVLTRPALAPCVWTTYIDPRSVVSAHANIGEGSFIAPFASCANVNLGRHVTIMACVVLGAHARIGDFSCVLPNATVASDAEIGSDCIIGMGARIAAGVRIGNGCSVAPNVVVRHDMPDGSIATSRGVRVRVRGKQKTGEVQGR